MPQRRRNRLTANPEEQATEARFERINRARLERVLAGLPPLQRDFLDVAPLLFHTNHPNLPGYVSSMTPCGIFNYSPSEKALRAARQLSTAFAPQQRALPRHHLFGLYLIGSAGTIGQSRSSDFDLWLCHRDDLEREAVAELTSKAESVERYASSLGLEVHFFVFSPTTFRMGKSLSLSSESSGSSQHYLLLDEFYRSGLVLAGVTPFWWRVPPEREADYSDFKAELSEQRAVHDFDYVDFGGLTHVPVDEFFGAALWQLSKSIDTPYKSVLKLLLMEAYAAEYPNTTLLSHRYKELVYQGVTELVELDPYILMYRRAEEYLLASEDHERLNVLRHSFYHKVHEPLSRPGASGHGEWRRAIMQNLVAEWGWGQAEIRRLDDRENWPIEAVAIERRALVNCFKKSYHILSEVARKNVSTRITSQDLTVLGRKLYAAFERKSGKVEIINHGISDLSFEAHLEVGHRDDGSRAGIWELRRPAAVGGAAAGQTIKRSTNPVALVAWALFNRVAATSTQWHLEARTKALAERDLRFLHETVFDAFSGREAGKKRIGAYTRPARIDRCLVLVNLGEDPLAGHTAGGHVLTSANTDALHFGGIGRNLVRRIDLLVRTTWGEYFYHCFRDGSALVESASLLAKWQFAGSGDEVLRVKCCSDLYQGVITERVHQFLCSALNFLNARGDDQSRCFVTRLEACPFVLARTAAGTSYQGLKSLYELEGYLDALPEASVRFAFDRDYFDDHSVAAALRRNVDGVWQIFLAQSVSQNDLVISDEHGRLFVERGIGEPATAITAHYWRFLASIRERRQREARAKPQSDDTIDIQVVRLRKSGSGIWTARGAGQPAPVTGDYLEVKVVGQVVSDNLREVVLVCNEREYSSTDYGSDVYRAAAEDILRYRASGATYPIYVTDMDIADTFFQHAERSNPPLARLLRYKSAVEARLNGALSALTRTGHVPEVSAPTSP